MIITDYFKSEGIQLENLILPELKSDIYVPFLEATIAADFSFILANVDSWIQFEEKQQNNTTDLLQFKIKNLLKLKVNVDRTRNNPSYLKGVLASPERWGVLLNVWRQGNEMVKYYKNKIPLPKKLPENKSTESSSQPETKKEGSNALQSVVKGTLFSPESTQPPEKSNQEPTSTGTDKTPTPGSSSSDK
jgi:hypothetical protein